MSACAHCGRTFAAPNSLWQHMRTKHPTEPRGPLPDSKRRQRKAAKRSVRRQIFNEHGDFNAWDLADSMGLPDGAFFAMVEELGGGW